jgi:FtsP/CotA-like multicopper oxidase with cupredoxin domain
MGNRCALFVGFGVLLAASMVAVAQSRCPARPLPGSTVNEPPAVYSQNGVLNLGLSFRNVRDTNGNMLYCYAYNNGTTEAPTLRVNPGDEIRLTLANELQGFSGAPMHHDQTMASGDPCQGTMTDASTNVHFHGLNVPPVCHQDEVIYTLINPGDPPFHYATRIPANEPPGLYWYHPHPHGMTLGQVLGGASGAIVVEGIEKQKPEVAGLTQRVIVMREEPVSSIDPDAGSLTINFVPATYPATLPPVIHVKPNEKQFWRVLNASPELFLTLQVLVNDRPENLQLIALDGVALKKDLTLKTISIPPSGRAEFIMQGPASGTATLNTLGVNTGKDGDPNPPQLIANIVASNSDAPAPLPPSTAKLSGPRRFVDLREQNVVTQRKLYFSEDLSDPDNPKFFITVAGQTPKQFDPNEPPAIVTQQGAVEDWTIENRSREIHAFHMHQIHFVVLARNGAPLANQEVQDTVPVPAWDGKSPTFPSVRLRMDFRYPETVGTFVYHCHILDHEDGGMMAKIQVLPAK